MRCGEGNAIECLFWHGDGSMKCQDETVSTWVCRCHHISLHVYKTQRCRLKCSSSRLSVLLNSNVLDSQHQKPKRTILTTFYGRSQQRDCVCQRPCSSGPHIHLCDHDSSHFLRVPLSTAPPVFSERVSHLSHCTEHLTNYSLRATNSHHEVP